MRHGHGHGHGDAGNRRASGLGHRASGRKTHVSAAATPSIAGEESRAEDYSAVLTTWAVHPAAWDPFLVASEPVGCVDGGGGGAGNPFIDVDVSVWLRDDEPRRRSISLDTARANCGCRRQSVG